MWVQLGMARPKTGQTPIKNLRVPQDLWDAVKMKAAERGETITQVVVRAFHRYLREKD